MFDDLIFTFRFFIHIFFFGKGYKCPSCFLMIALRWSTLATVFSLFICVLGLEAYSGLGMGGQLTFLSFFVFFFFSSANFLVVGVRSYIAAND